VVKRIDRRDGGLAVADADGARLFGQGGKSPIVERAPISETISLLVETDDRRDHHIRHKFRAIGGNRNVPDSRRQWLAGAPKPKNQRSVFLHDYGENASGAARADRLGPASEIRLSTKRPIEADGNSSEIGEQHVEMGSDLARAIAALVIRDHKPQSDQPLAFVLSPTDDVIELP
jgi:hypothetical protein